MQFKPPKNDDKYRWTNHVKGKMVYYGISEGLIKRIVRFPKRKEDGVAERTVAVMQPTSNKKKPQEVWVMYQQIDQNLRSQTINSKFQIPAVRIISAWRYPGISPAGRPIQIPDDVLQELDNLLE
ncbi:MAG: hypothetical protein A2831_01270 [Candidatus Yanofskybacteria bacterium RIFCSPHIGHO2_01_FULL_44_17]|uniref:Uncharacterized protein n=1 Tax=Candidatus Yanofskybacteria bacterium RIFCSPHIGHO2_01_FULL_44_17 TaxID=1802668 RepID=A0A1F8EU02_9BACT|nr:MAG: hypothetical protein A2831_01270 [Candidatus Yanofskybacteria bacterium RIFCSPHIGHO2_01_FULL_44_17]